MSERIYNGPLTEAVILEWGYDEEMILSSQDEDLVLGAAHRFYPVLCRLAMDAECPKADYCLSIMDFSLMFGVLRKHEGAADEIRQTIELLRDCKDDRVNRFISVNLLRLALLAHEQVLTLERAEEIGRAALNGVSRQADILVKDECENWTIELSVPPFHRHKEWLTISKRTGQYSFNR